MQATNSQRATEGHRCNSHPDVPLGALLAALTTRYRPRGGPRGWTQVHLSPYLVAVQGSLKDRRPCVLQDLSLSPTHLPLAPRPNLYQASSSRQAPGSFRSLLPDGGPICPEAWPRPQLPAFVWQVLSVPSVTGWREHGKPHMLSLPSSAAQGAWAYMSRPPP